MLTTYRQPAISWLRIYPKNDHPPQKAWASLTEGKKKKKIISLFPLFSFCLFFLCHGGSKNKLFGGANLAGIAAAPVEHIMVHDEVAKRSLFKYGPIY